VFIDVVFACLEKAWKRMVTKVCYVGEGFTRKPPKYERFIRPMVRKINCSNLVQTVPCTQKEIYAFMLHYGLPSLPSSLNGGKCV